MQAASVTAPVVESATLLLAVIIPLIGSLVVMTLKNNPNLREFVSSCAPVLLFLVVLSFIPALKSGETLTCTLFRLLPGLSITLRADGFSMIFALVASSLWMIAVFYSMGYMRAHDEHCQTRFNACFGEVTGRSLIHPARTTNAEGHLDGRIAIRFSRFDLGHTVVGHVQHSHRNGSTILGKNASHAHLAPDKA